MPGHLYSSALRWLVGQGRCGRGRTGFPATTTSWSAAALRPDSGVRRWVSSGQRKLELAASLWHQPRTPEPCEWDWERGTVQPLRSLPEMAPCVLQGLAHGRDTGRTHARKGLFTHRSALSEVGRASRTAGIRGVTPVVGAGTPSLVNISSVRRTGQARPWAPQWDCGPCQGRAALVLRRHRALRHGWPCPAGRPLGVHASPTRVRPHRWGHFRQL